MSLTIHDATERDYRSIVDYFTSGSKSFLNGMGVDPKLLPQPEEWVRTMLTNHKLDDEQKELFYQIWHIDGQPVGHSNINKIIFGKEAYMHLHMWSPGDRRQGAGLDFVKLCVPVYFERFRLELLLCEPYALNPAPNRSLPKLHFDFVTEYETRPGLICFQQKVNRWALTREQYNKFYRSSAATL